jgi:hypothetical protein
MMRDASYGLRITESARSLLCYRASKTKFKCMTEAASPASRGLRSAPGPSQRNIHCTAGDRRTDACWKYKLASDARAKYCCYGAASVGKDPAIPSANHLRTGVDMFMELFLDITPQLI